MKRRSKHGELSARDKRKDIGKVVKKERREKEKSPPQKNLRRRMEEDPMRERMSMYKKNINLKINGFLDA